MKILYVGHFHNNSGWSRAALDYVLAMDKVGIDVVPRSIRLNEQNPELPERYKELEAKSDKGCDIVIQHVLPHHLLYNGKFKKNIAYCVYESAGQWLHNWSSQINMMDELWVPSLFTQQCFHKGGVNIQIRQIPHTFDIDRYNKTYDKLQIPELDGNYVFYTIADMNVRKNLPALLKAFHYEFSINEPVSLCIKCSKYGTEPEKLFEMIKQDCTTIKQHMKLYTKENLYKPELLITSFLPDEEIMKLHARCDCYVNTSHGEAWCIPLYEAMALGKQIVCPDDMYGYINRVECDTFKTYTDINLRCTDTFKEIGSSYELWKEMSVLEVARAMRAAYWRSTNDTKKQARINRAAEYSYDKIGKMIKEALVWHLQ